MANPSHSAASHDAKAGSSYPGTQENFAALLEETLGQGEGLEGRVITGTVVSIEKEFAVIDVGLKSEGRIPLSELGTPGQPAEIKVGDKIDVYLERMEDKNGEAQLSRERARREEAWNVIENLFKNNERVMGAIYGRVKGGFTVDLSGATAFLPGSQVDIRPVRDIAPMLNVQQTFQILKMDRRRGNIVVSRRAVLEESRAEARTELVSSLKEGQVLQGVVKNITDYGAFVDLGGVDGLLHVTDIAWRRINHPAEAIHIGQSVMVQVIRFNTDTQRISLGMKQLEVDPWEGVAQKYQANSRFKGRVTNITDYGAFVELEPGIEGLVHVSEMSWTKKNTHPGKIISTSQEVDVMVLDVDSQKRRISLGLKQCMDNPWDNFTEKFPIGSEIEGEIKNITEFGLFVGLPGDIDGMVHLSDLDWNRPGEEVVAEYKKGDMIKTKLLDVDTDKERISLGVKQLTADPFESGIANLKRGDIITCAITAIQENGIEVDMGEAGHGFIRKAELGRNRADQDTARFKIGDKVEAKITALERSSRRIQLSIKAREVDEEKKAMAEFATTESGASLGDILGAAIRNARGKDGEEGEADEK